MDDLKQLLRENFEYSMTDVHTCFPGVVVKYDAKTRRADIQPSLKRRLPDGSFADFPIIPDIPVQFPGTKKWTFHFPLEKDDEVSVHAIERSTDIWRDNGGNGIEDSDPRRFNLQDCYAVPGLQPQDSIPATEAGLQVIHKDKPDGELISQVLMTDDKIETIYKKKAKVTMEDDHITSETEKCKVEMSADVLTAKNSQTTVKLNGDKASVKNGSKSLYTILHEYYQSWLTNKPVTTGSPATHFLHPNLEKAILQADTDLGLLLEA